MAQITYTNKVALNENPEIADINKVTDDDMNEIKSVVNANYNNTIQITDTQPSDSDNKIWIDTGAVQNIGSEIESGSSTNANWIKLADGTLIQYSNTSVSKSLNANSQGYETINLPISFIDTDYFASTNCSNGYPEAHTCITTRTTNTMELIFTNRTDHTQSIVATWFAIGRWKA